MNSEEDQKDESAESAHKIYVTNNGCLVFNDLSMYELISSQRLVPVPIGTPAISQNQSLQLASPFILDKYSSRLLFEMDVLSAELKEEINLQNNEDSKFQNSKLDVDELNNKMSKMKLSDSKYLIFKNLHQKCGLYITNGIKYGADFLVYKGDPNVFHSEYMVKVVENQDSIDIRDLIALERVASLSKKLLRYAFIDDTGDVKFIQIEHNLINK